MAKTDELRALLAAATPGPWASRPTETPEGDLLEDIVAKGSGNLTVASECEERDADLIIAAVNALPWLLAALEASDASREAQWQRAERVEADAQAAFKALETALATVREIKGMLLSLLDAK